MDRISTKAFKEVASGTGLGGLDLAVVAPRNATAAGLARADALADEILELEKAKAVAAAHYAKCVCELRIAGHPPTWRWLWWRCAASKEIDREREGEQQRERVRKGRSTPTTH